MSTEPHQPDGTSEADTETSTGTAGEENGEEPMDTSDRTEPAAFSATITVGYVQRFLDAIRTVDDEFRLHVSPIGVSGRVVGPENTTLVEARLGTDAFESYTTDGDNGVIGFSAKRLREIVRMSNNSDLMAFDLSDTGQTLRVQAGALDCSLQLTDPAMIRSTSGLEDEEYPSVVVLEGGELKRIVKAAGHVDDAVAFRIERDDERFVAEADNGDDSLRAPRDAADLVELFGGDEPVGATFDLSYLRKAKRAIRKRTEVTLALGTDLPLSVAFDIADGAGHVEYGIAPVVEDD